MTGLIKSIAYQYRNPEMRAARASFGYERLSITDDVCDHCCGDVLKSNNLRNAHTSPGFFAVGIFLCFGASMAGLAASTLLLPGTILDRAWALNPNAYQQLLPVNSIAGPLFFLLGLLLALSAVGWFRRRRWAWRLTVIIIAMQAFGDILNLLRGDWLRGGLGVTIAGGILLYLFTPDIKSAFPTSPD